MIVHHFHKPLHQLELVVATDILSTHVDALRTEIHSLFNNHDIWYADWNTLDLDLRQVQLIDSLGLNLLVSVIKHVSERPASVTARIRSHAVRQVFLATRLDKLVTLHEH